MANTNASDTAPTVADRVKALRKAAGLTQEKLAAAAGLDRVEIVRIEGGRNQCSSGRIQEGLGRAFGLRMEDVKALVEGRLTVEVATQLIAARKGS